MSGTNRVYRIAVIPGDGIGKEVMPEGLRVLEAASKKYGFELRLDEFDFDIITRALSGSAIPSDTLRVVYGSEAAKTRGSRNQNGISEPAIDAMIEKIGQARSYAEAVTAAKCLDRLLRAGRYWIPMWWNDQVWIAHWDMFDRPQTKPKYGSGAPGTWWYDAEKAKRIGKA